MLDDTKKSTVVTRFAPSPTGFLHIGGARTALFNWLYARHNAGTFLLRIEDTDRARSTPDMVQAIYNGMQWLGLDWDGEPISQYNRRQRHQNIAQELLEKGQAYKCFSTPSDINAFRAQAKLKNESTLFQSPWRDTPEHRHTTAPFVIRLRTPRTGHTVVQDKVQGNITWQNKTLDDMVLLRSDGSPTYMLAVVVDDHDMGVTDIIRGDDHLANAGRQSLIYNALNWHCPAFAHIPLIHGSHGAKLSKRDGALDIIEYQRMGYQARAMRNYLVRLGWSYGDQEIFQDSDLVRCFNIKNIGKSPARFDSKKLDYISKHHIAASGDNELLHDIVDYLKSAQQKPLRTEQKHKLLQTMGCLKKQAHNLSDLIARATFILCKRPIEYDRDAVNAIGALTNKFDPALQNKLTLHLQNVIWDKENLENCFSEFCQNHALKMRDIAGYVRIALSGRTISPSIFDMMIFLGQKESLDRLHDIALATKHYKPK